jgi:ribose transport system ATP-binding protein
MLEIKHVSKGFPGVQALDDISVQFYPGEIHALVGENGAGKSTLIKIIAGIYRPDEGEVSLDGEKLNMHSYSDAIKKSINVVSQEIQVIPNSTIAENCMLDKLESYSKMGTIDWKKANQDARTFIDLVDLKLPETTPARELSAAQKQLVMIARALSTQARVLILDEPTSSLTIRETENLLRILSRLKSQGVTVIFVSHKLEEVLNVSDKVTVLRDGHKIGTKETKNLNKEEIITMMIGRGSHNEHLGYLEIDNNRAVLETRNLQRLGKFDNIQFKLYKGEILGFYGLIGSGRTELAQLIIGEDHKDGGSVLVNGKEAHIRSMADSLYHYRIGYISENRKEKGLILDASIDTNVTITVWNKLLTPFKNINLKSEKETTLQLMENLDIRATGPNQIVRRLSGGNQQKVSIGKWLAANCDILIIDEPTVGVDIGAKEAIHRLIWNLAKEEGKSIIIISSDMPEIINLARRILVFKDFQIVGEISGMNDREHSYEEVSQSIGQLLA